MNKILLIMKITSTETFLIMVIALPFLSFSYNESVALQFNKIAEIIKGINYRINTIRFELFGNSTEEAEYQQQINDEIKYVIECLGKNPEQIVELYQKIMDLIENLSQIVTLIFNGEIFKTIHQIKLLFQSVLSNLDSCLETVPNSKSFLSNLKDKEFKQISFDSLMNLANNESDANLKLKEIQNNYYKSSYMNMGENVVDLYLLNNPLKANKENRENKNSKLVSNANESSNANTSVNIIKNSVSGNTSTNYSQVLDKKIMNESSESHNGRTLLALSHLQHNNLQSNLNRYSTNLRRNNEVEIMNGYN